MNIKYLGTLLAAFILSLGLITSCASPEGGETEVEPDAGVTEPEMEMEEEAVEPEMEMEEEAVEPEPAE